jgi:hypothetical protein
MSCFAECATIAAATFQTAHAAQSNLDQDKSTNYTFILLARLVSNARHKVAEPPFLTTKLTSTQESVTLLLLRAFLAVARKFLRETRHKSKSISKICAEI